MAKPNPGKLKDDATKYLNKGKLDKALEAYQELEKVAPDDLKVPQKIAEILLKMNKKEPAIAKYKESAEKYRQRGFLVQAIAIYKVIIGIAPDNQEVNTLISQLMDERVGSSLPLGKPKEKSPPPAVKKEIVAPKPEEKAPPLKKEEEKRPEFVRPPAKAEAAPPAEAEEPIAAPSGDEAAELGVPVEPEGESGLERGPEAGAGIAAAEDTEIALEAEGGDLELGEPGSAQGPTDEEMLDIEQHRPEPGGPEFAKEAAGAFELGNGQIDETAGVGAGSKASASAVAQSSLGDPMDFLEAGAAAETAAPPEAAAEGPGESGLELDEGTAPEPSAPEGEAASLEAGAEEGDEAEVDIEVETAGEDAGEPSDVVPLEQEEDLPAAGPERTPLFSDLASGEFQRVFEFLVSRVIEPGAIIVKEGEAGDSIYIIARGEVRITRAKEGIDEREVAILGPGSFFGEMGYFYGDRKATVTAVKKCLLLEMTKPDLDSVVAEFPRVKEVLLQFYRERVLENLLADSPLFRDLSGEERKYFQERFEYREYLPGETVVEEGAPGDSMFLIKSGHVAVQTVHPVTNDTVELARLKGGDFFGEVGLVKNKPRTATIKTLDPTEVLELSREAFQEIAQHHPEIGAALEQTIEQRVEQTIKKMIGSL